MKARRIAAVLAGSLLALGCFVDHGPIPGGEGSSSGDTTTTGGSATDPTTSATMTTAPTSTTATTNQGTSSGSTGEPLEPLPQACSDYCDAITACGSGTTPTCVEDCVAGTTMDPNPSEACVSAAISFAECGAALSCETIDAPLQECALELGILLANCTTCKDEVNARGSACTVTRECQVDHFLAECSQTSCFCSKNDVRGRSCELMDDLCALPEDELITQISACCMWSP